MIVRRPFAVLLIALAIAACSKKAEDKGAIPSPSSPVAVVAPPAGKSWTDIVSATPDGGMRMGNPDAPIKLVEYASFTCPHCKHFEDEGADALQQKYVSSGKVSWEFRSFLIHGPDAPITLLMNCRGPDPYFKLAQQLYATQDSWFGEAAIKKLTEDQQRLQGLPPIEQFKALIDDLGLYGFFAARGLPRSAADACLSDQKAIDGLTAATQRYSTVDNIAGTPTFMINGQLWDYANTGPTVWKQLDPVLAKMTR